MVRTAAEVPISIAICPFRTAPTPMVVATPSEDPITNGVCAGIPICFANCGFKPWTWWVASTTCGNWEACNPSCCKAATSHCISRVLNNPVAAAIGCSSKNWPKYFQIMYDLIPSQYLACLNRAGASCLYHCNL